MRETCIKVKLNKMQVKIIK